MQCSFITGEDLTATVDMTCTVQVHFIGGGGVLRRAEEEAQECPERVTSTFGKRIQALLMGHQASIDDSCKENTVQTRSNDDWSTPVGVVIVSHSPLLRTQD